VPKHLELIHSRKAADHQGHLNGLEVGPDHTGEAFPLQGLRSFGEMVEGGETLPPPFVRHLLSLVGLSSGDLPEMQISKCQIKP